MILSTACADRRTKIQSVRFREGEPGRASWRAAWITLLSLNVHDFLAAGSGSILPALPYLQD
jgi:hypothetical protein